mmetsp:Transcript_24074/g.49693  ORF Transcript_24074/g.49693 Transcript_24074/m.49693 type:complete len:211 (-) Transcript_24074:134-766(-)
MQSIVLRGGEWSFERGRLVVVIVVVEAVVSTSQNGPTEHGLQPPPLPPSNPRPIWLSHHLTHDDVVPPSRTHHSPPVVVPPPLRPPLPNPSSPPRRRHHLLRHQNGHHVDESHSLPAPARGGRRRRLPPRPRPTRRPPQSPRPDLSGGVLRHAGASLARSVRDLFPRSGRENGARGRVRGFRRGGVGGSASSEDVCDAFVREEVFAREVV